LWPSRLTSNWLAPFPKSQRWPKVKVAGLGFEKRTLFFVGKMIVYF
jgi:hypothetical protein